MINGIKNLFIPSVDYFPQKFGQVRSEFDDRLPIVADLSDMMRTIISALQDCGNFPPEITISIPQWGFEGQIIDLSFYAQYRVWIHGLIAVGAWVMFVLRTIKRLPSLLSLPS